MIIKFLKLIVNNEKKSYYPLSIFLMSIFFWYVFFSNILDLKKNIFLGALLTFVIYSFLRIIKKIPHHQIPEHYSEGAKTSMRIFIFMALLGLLIYYLYKYKLFD